jgi:hypothetical protein
LNKNWSTYLTALAEAEREYAAGVPYQGLLSWPEKIVRIKQHIADPREMIANESSPSGTAKP